MTDGQAQRRLRLNYVVAELDVVLHELLADVPFVTETTLRDKYRQLCGKELKSVLDAVGMMLHELVELKFADAFVAVRNAKMTDFLRRKFVNQPVVLAADASRKDAGVQQVRVKAEPGAVSVGSLDSAYLDLADAAVAADASDDAAPKPKRALMGEPEERGGNAGDGDSASGPVAVRVGPTPPVMSYFDAAQSLGASKIQSKDLEHTRRGLLLKRQDTTGGLALSVFDFHALINNESTLTHAEYARQKSSGNQWKKVAYRLLSFGLKGLPLSS
ncbi:hypothetical protein AAVH_29195 [Aphelenchoides avenae]|nr:hypothetical protein AAVH_29195 [Aphelenchus avenae]